MIKIKIIGVKLEKGKPTVEVLDKYYTIIQFDENNEKEVEMAKEELKKHGIKNFWHKSANNKKTVCEILYNENGETKTGKLADIYLVEDEVTGKPKIFPMFFPEVLKELNEDKNIKWIATTSFEEEIEKEEK